MGSAAPVRAIEEKINLAYEGIKKVFSHEILHNKKNNIMNIDKVLLGGVS